MDILEAEWEALQQGTLTVNAYYAKFVELCHAVQLDITSTFVVRKVLRNLNTLLNSNLIIHFGGKLEVEGVDLEVIRRVAQQFEAAVAQQTKTVVAKAAPTKTVTDRQQLQCSYCNIKGHNITTCYKKSNADSKQTTTTSNNNTSHNNYSKFHKASNNSSHNTIPLHALIHLLPLLTLLLRNPAMISVIDVGRQVIDVVIAPIGSRGTPGGNRLGWSLVIV
jgi:hypothetical protein